MKRWYLMSFLVFLSTGWCGWVSENATFINVVDGDTIHVSFKKNTKTSVRLLYIDTFETSRNAKMKSDISTLRAQGYAVSEKMLLDRGYEAKRWLLRRISKGTVIRLEWDENKTADRYGRLLALVYHPVDNTTSLNEELILQGLARPYFVGKTPPDHKKRMENAYKHALSKNRWQWLENTKR